MPNPETPPTETPGQEPGATETPPESPTLPTGDVPPEVPPETPPEVPPEMSPEERRDHDMRSWIGRRDAEIRTEMDRRDQAILNEIRGIRTGAEVPPAELPDPSIDADAWFAHKTKERETQQVTYNETLIKTGTAILQQDELTRDDPALAQEIYEEVQQGRVLIDRSLRPEVAADVAIAKAKSNILTRRIGKKVNPLEANRPTGVPKGGITPPAAPAAPAAKLPKMSTLATSAAKRWGMSDDEVAKILE